MRAFAKQRCSLAYPSGASSEKGAVRTSPGLYKPSWDLSCPAVHARHLCCPRPLDLKPAAPGTRSPTSGVDRLPRSTRAAAARAKPRDGEARAETEPTDPRAFPYSRKGVSTQSKTSPESGLSGSGRAAGPAAPSLERAPSAPQASFHLQTTDLSNDISAPDNGSR